MTEQKKPGRPRKWSSDAERMRAARAAKREQQRAEEEWRAARARRREHPRRAASASQSTAEPTSGESCAPKAGNTWMAVHATCEANIRKLQEEVRRLEDDYDDTVYDRWMLEHQYRMAVARMRDRDPEGLAWLDDQVRRWELRRSDYREDRRRLRRSKS